MNMEQIRQMLKKPQIKWVELSGLYPEILEERHVKLCMPVANLHLNHVNTVYAGSIFTLAELTAGALFFVSYGVDQYAPIVRKAEIQYLKPATTDISVEASMTEEEAQAKIAPVNERGKGDMFLELVVKDIENNECAKVNINFYCIPVNKIK